MKFEFREIILSKLIDKGLSTGQGQGAVLEVQGHQPELQKSASPYIARLDSPSSELGTHRESDIRMPAWKAGQEGRLCGWAGTVSLWPGRAGKLL